MLWINIGLGLIGGMMLFKFIRRDKLYEKYGEEKKERLEEMEIEERKVKEAIKNLNEYIRENESKGINDIDDLILIEEKLEYILRIIYKE